MARIPTRELSRYLLSGRISTPGCLIRRVSVASRPHHPPQSAARQPNTLRRLHTDVASTHPNLSSTVSTEEPLRKQLKDSKKARRAADHDQARSAPKQALEGWELTVGIEIHAQLNTPRKLFSPSASFFSRDPNSNVSYFDLAIPGSQPIFQPEVLIPAIRAALALNCDIQDVSRFDRKHYFHWDQPAGYQITQFYKPFAKDGHIMLYQRDGIAAEDGDQVRVDITQIQMEQDTAKTTRHPNGEYRLDFNRAGAPLIEIITMPQMHHPATAAAFVRKVQRLLLSVDACTSGMERGGLRADVNVSVQRAGEVSKELGTRVEIKNLSSFKAVEEAIFAERKRQTDSISANEPIRQHTRGWNGEESVALRDKEGEEDYRYMPDPDLGPVVIGKDLVEHLRDTIGVLPDAEVEDLVANYGFSPKDATALMQLDDGGRAQFYYDVVDALEIRLQKDDEASSGKPVQGGQDRLPHRRLAKNWVLHDLGRLTSERNSNEESDNTLEMTPEGRCRIPVDDLADVLFYVHRQRITTAVAKELLFAIFRGDEGYRNVADMIEQNGLWLKEISDNQYEELARNALEGQEKLIKEFAKTPTYPQGKLGFLMQRMLRSGPEGRLTPANAERILRRVLDEVVQSSKGS